MKFPCISTTVVSLLLIGQPLSTNALVTPLLQPARPSEPQTTRTLISTEITKNPSRRHTQLYNFFDDVFGGNDDNKKNDKNSISSFRTVDGDDSSPSMAEFEKLEVEMDDQSNVLLGLELAMEELQSVLDSKQAALEEQQDKWGQEKTGLVAQIAALTSSIQQAGNDKDIEESQQQQEEDYKIEKERLEREISLLQNQKSVVESRLTQEQEKNDALQKRLQKATDSLEFEQMMFFKEKRELEEKVSQQKSQLTIVENKLKREESKFGDNQETLKQQLQEEQQRLAETRQQIQRWQEEYQQGQEALKEKVRQEEQALKEAQRQLEQERRQNQRDQERLKTQLEQEETMLATLEDAIAQETAQFESIQPFLEQTIQEEKEKVDGVTRQLEKEQQRFATEKERLQTQINAELKRLTQVEEQLSKERYDFQKTKDKMELESSKLSLQREQDRKRMKKRYGNLRDAMGERVSGEKLNGRYEIRSLTKRYTAELDLTQDVIAKLQDQITVTSDSCASIQVMVNDMQAQIRQVRLDQIASETRYQRLISDRNVEITTLKNDMKDLQSTLVERDEDIERIESSLREIAKTSLKLTGRRLNKVNPLRLLRRSKKN